jgi:hypothetical protein
VSTSFNPSVDPSTLERARQQVNRLIEEVARLSESDLPPTNYYGEFLERVLQAIAAPAGIVWVRNPQGHLQVQYQINARQVGVDATDEARLSHGELLRQASQLARPMLLRPHSGTDVPDESGTAAANPTAYMILLVPILVDKVVIGLVEIFQDPNRNPEAQRGFLQFLVRMAELASTYIRNQNMRQMAGQQQVWTQLEAYARQIHSSLNPTEVAYLIVNEGRRLLECDRVSIAVRHGKRTKVEAISGADVVEKRSNLVQLMRSLCDEVLKWGDKLVYVGNKDDTLPPKVLHALDAYLAESNSKLLIVLPMKDEREANSKKPGRSVMVVESFEPVESPEQMQARLEVLSKHAGSALYNAVEHRRIPMRFIWQPIAQVQEGLGGKARAIGIAITAAVVVLLLVLIFVPYPLKMESKGSALPVERRWMYSPLEARVAMFADGVRPGQPVGKDQNVILMHDVQQEVKIVELSNQILGAQQECVAIKRQLDTATNQQDRAKYSSSLSEKQSVLQRKTAELETLLQRINGVRDRPGYFWLKSPISGTVLNWDFRENLTNRFVKPSEQLLRIGDKSRQWEVELKIPQKHIGQVLKAFDPKDPSKELDVDLLVMSEPTRTFKGKLARNKIAGEAVPNRDDNNESEPVVLASVRVAGPGIAESDRIPESLLQSGVEVHSKIRCGNRAMGYSLFYGLWEFFYEKVVFFF